MSKIYENDVEIGISDDEINLLLEEEKIILIKNENPCRICLEENYEKKRYCDCKGSLASVHEECLISWLEYHNKLTGERIFCEICKKEFELKYIRTKGYYITHTIELILIFMLFIVIVVCVIVYHMYGVLIILASLPIYSCSIVLINKITENIIKRYKMEKITLISKKES